MKLIKNILLLSLMFSFSNCDKETNEINPSDIKCAISLSNNSIHALKGSKETRSGEQPRLWEAGWDDELFYVVKFVYSWNSSNDDFINIDLIVAESKILANKYLTERRETSSLPLNLLQPKDNPTIAGDISYGNGRDFIRNNIIIEIHAEGDFENKVKDIAQQIDNLIIKSKSYKSLSEVKPLINKFEISENPVLRNSKSELIYNLYDPLGKDLFINWRFKGGAGNRYGAIKDETGEYHYYADTDETEDRLTLIVASESGFTADSTMIININ